MDLVSLFIFLVTTTVLVRSDWTVEIPLANSVFSANAHSRLSCHVIGTGQNATFEWDHPRTGSFTSFGSKLSMDTVTSEESGIYTCHAIIGSIKRSASVNITIYDFPIPVDCKEIQHPLIGSDAHIRCSLKNAHQFVNTWSIGGRPIIENERFSFEDDGTTLVIKNFTSDMDKIYRFDSYVTETNVDLAKEISVAGYEYAVVETFNAPTTVFEGSPAYFDCVASGIPKPTIKWLKSTNSEKFEEISSSKEYDLKTNGSLVINKFAPEDEGSYSCVADNVLNKSDKKSARVSVYKLPRLKQFGSVEAAVGSELRVPCIADGPEVTVNWSFNGDTIADLKDDSDVFGVTQNGTTLVIPNVQVDGYLDFVCTASNQAGFAQDSLSIKITSLPAFTSHSPVINPAVLNKKATLFCNASGTPTPEITWFRSGDDESLAADGVTYTKVDNGGNSSLIIIITDERMFGNYSCLANNSVGSVRSPEMILFQVKPPVLPDSIECDDLTFPTRAKCQIIYKNINNHHVPDAFNARCTNKAFPTGSKHNEYDLFFNYTDADTPTFVEINGLNTSSEYSVEFQAVNIAGKSIWSGSHRVETSESREPEPVIDITTECLDVCLIRWTPGSDNGEKITYYEVKLFNLIAGQQSPFFIKTTNESSLEVFPLSSHTTYRVEVRANNIKGYSPVAEVSMTTNEMETFSKFKLIAVILTAVVLLVLILIITDTLLYRFKKVSVIRCLVPCCCKREEIKTDGAAPGEDQHLLTEPESTKSGRKNTAASVPNDIV